MFLLLPFSEYHRNHTFRTSVPFRTPTKFLASDAGSFLVFPLITCVKKKKKKKCLLSRKDLVQKEKAVLIIKEKVFHFFFLSIFPVWRSNFKTNACHFIKIRGMKQTVKPEKYMHTLNYVANVSFCFLSFVLLIGWGNCNIPRAYIFPILFNSAT